MQLLDLPLDVFRVLIKHIVKKLWLRELLRARLTCKTFSVEIFDAVIKTKGVEDTFRSKVGFFPNVLAQYLHHRVRTDPKDTSHPWITAIRKTSQQLATLCEKTADHVFLELMEQRLCLCLAVVRGTWAIRYMSDTYTQDVWSVEEDISSNCLAIAAWMGNLSLVETLYRGSDPLTLFGRPSWAAATQGHSQLLQWMLSRGALPYEPTLERIAALQLGRDLLGAAAYMGHEETVQLLLRQPYYQENERRGGCSSIWSSVRYAAYGNQSATLITLLEYQKSRVTSAEFIKDIDHSLRRCCCNGAAVSAQVLLDYGADVDVTDDLAVSCIQRAAMIGSVPLVQVLLLAGASLDRTNMVRFRPYEAEKREYRGGARHPVDYARRLGHVDVLEILESTATTARSAKWADPFVEAQSHENA